MSPATAAILCLAFCHSIVLSFLRDHLCRNIPNLRKSSLVHIPLNPFAICKRAWSDLGFISRTGVFRLERHRNTATSKAPHRLTRPSPASTSVTVSTDQGRFPRPFRRRDHLNPSTPSRTTPKPRGWRRRRCKGTEVAFLPRSRRWSNQRKEFNISYNVPVPFLSDIPLSPLFCFLLKLPNLPKYPLDVV